MKVCRCALPKPCWLTLAWLALLLLHSSKGFADCKVLEEDGTWTSVPANHAGIAQITVEFSCHDAPDLSNIPERPSAWHVRALGACSSGPCDWGWSDAESASDDRDAARGRSIIFFVRKDSVATRYLFARMSPYGGRQLEVYVWTEFVSARRTHYGFWAWFDPVERAVPGRTRDESTDKEPPLTLKTDSMLHAVMKPPPLVLAAMAGRVGTAHAPFPNDPSPPKGALPKPRTTPKHQ